MHFQAVVDQAQRIFTETRWRLLSIRTEDNAYELSLAKGAEDAVLTTHREGEAEEVEIIWLAELPETLVNRTDWKPLLLQTNEE